MGITYGDHLIDFGYRDITSEQEREIDEARDERALDRFRKALVKVRDIAKNGTRNTAAWQDVLEIADVALRGETE